MQQTQCKESSSPICRWLWDIISTFPLHSINTIASRRCRCPNVPNICSPKTIRRHNHFLNNEQRKNVYNSFMLFIGNEIPIKQIEQSDNKKLCCEPRLFFSFKRLRCIPLFTELYDLSFSVAISSALSRRNKIITRLLSNNCHRVSL